MTTKHSWDKGDVDLNYPTIADRVETLSSRFWTWAAIYAEARWLKANGWIQVRNGWLLPDWHPKKLRALAKQPNFSEPPPYLWTSSWRPRTAIPELNEPYDQNHAANSQRAHTLRRTVQFRHAHGQKAPAFPPYIKGWSTLPITQTLGFTVVCAQLAVGDHWGRHLFFLAAVLLFCVSFCISRVSRREWELDWAETQLDRRTHGIHRPN